jgi:hypothetical protein
MGPVGAVGAMPPLAFLVLYVATGIFQPTLVDYIKYQGGTGRSEPPLLLPPLSSAVLAMPLVALLPRRCMREEGGYSVDRYTYTSIVEDLARRRLWLASGVDILSSTFLVTAGLLLTGSSVYVVLYGSNTLWTAMLAWCLSKKRQSFGQWVGIGILSVGLLVNAVGNHSLGGVAAANGLWGSALVLAGTLLHSLYFITAESVIGCMSTQR